MLDAKWWESLWSWEATAVYFAWYMWTVACWMALPGKEVEGVELRNGKRLTYTMNGSLLLRLLSYDRDADEIPVHSLLHPRSHPLRHRLVDVQAWSRRASLYSSQLAATHLGCDCDELVPGTLLPPPVNPPID